MPKSSSGGDKIFFKRIGRDPAERGMGAHGVIKGLDVGEHVGLRLNAGGVVREVNQ